MAAETAVDLLTSRVQTSDEDNAEEIVGEMNTDAGTTVNDEEAVIGATNSPIMDETQQ
jgi:hypothetical protein